MKEGVQSRWEWGDFVMGGVISLVCVMIYHFAGIENLGAAVGLITMLGIGMVLGLAIGLVRRRISNQRKS